jgi:hypothetical protein
MKLKATNEGGNREKKELKKRKEKTRKDNRKKRKNEKSQSETQREKAKKKTTRTAESERSGSKKKKTNRSQLKNPAAAHPYLRRAPHPRRPPVASILPVTAKGSKPPPSPLPRHTPSLPGSALVAGLSPGRAAARL